MLAALCAAGCLVPNRYLPRLPNDKLMHFGAFAVLSALALHMARDRAEAALWLLALLVAGWLIECLQILVPERAFCWRDVAANAGGIACSAILASVYVALS
ncbi:MAG: VanZ family protein [Pseudomonadota bacterium]